MTPRERKIRRRLRDDFAHYAARCLKIRTKQGGIKPLILNRAQQYLHGRLEEQLARTGRVRALVLKGRQQGVSSYVEGRFYWKVTHRKGVQAYILTHEQQATDNLYRMVQRYHEHCPTPVKPQTSASNAKELIFNLLDSGYKIGTAGTRGTGRSATIQFLHGSEVAFWPHADEHAAGVMQAVPDAPGTEIILESTANGMGNLFHQFWQRAEAGMGEYIPAFIPWFWQEEYSKSLAAEFRPSPEEADYAEQYGLATEQTAWMHAKLTEFKGDWMLFHQEYPATPALAFQFSATESFIPAEMILRARKVQGAPFGAIVAGLDPARFGDDRTALAVRQGRKVLHMQAWERRDTMEVVGLAIKALERHKIDKLFIDVGGLGAGVVDRLRELGHGKRIMAVNAGDRATEQAKYLNKRAEMWAGIKEWLREGEAQIPDNDALQADLQGPGYSYDSNTRLKIERKEDMKKRGLRSPDLADALCLTFAYPVAPKKPQEDASAADAPFSADAWMAM